MAPAPNPKDSMKSTWRTQSKDNWTFHHWIIHKLNVYPTDLSQPVPVHPKTDKIPYLPQWSQHSWVLAYSMIPFAIHQTLLRYTGIDSLSGFAVFNLYFTAFNAIIVRQVHVLRRLGHQYGFLDGDKHERDGVPDVGVAKVAAALYKTTGSRIALAVFLTYDQSKSPVDVLGDWQWWAWLVLNIGLYGIILDFWFYTYHRAMHEIPFLWKFHRTHHLTKHPNALLSAYADHEQEFFDMVGVPFMTYVTMRAFGIHLDFYGWWVCHQYIAFTEVWGHSGIRVKAHATSTLGWFLVLVGGDIVVEDHDLHHRRGWRKSHNYGKQTRLWDRIFGTTADRIETIDSNIDYENQARMPIF